MSKKVLIASLIAIILLMAGCGNKLTEGEVCHKEYLPAETKLMFIPLVTSNGKTCTTRLIPYFVHYPDRYLVVIKAFVDDEWNYALYYTSQEVYEIVEIGDMFEYDKDRDFTQEPYTKERAG